MNSRGYHYLVCALWSSTDDEGEPLDNGYALSDLDVSVVTQATADLEAFEAMAGDDLDLLDDEQIGHDLWLTRNGHSAGFWDRGLGELGERLTRYAKTLGEVDLYVGDDGKIYS